MSLLILGSKIIWLYQPRDNTRVDKKGEFQDIKRPMLVDTNWRRKGEYKHHNASSCYGDSAWLISQKWSQKRTALQRRETQRISNIHVFVFQLHCKKKRSLQPSQVISVTQLLYPIMCLENVGAYYRNSDCLFLQQHPMPTYFVRLQHG